MDKEELLSFARDGLALSKEDFLARFQHPFLLEEASASEPKGRAFQTMIGGVSAAPRPPSPLNKKFVYAVRKTERNKFGAMITVGRADNNDIILEEGSVSKFHAYVSCDQRKDEWFLTDAESRFGTFVDDRKIPPGVAKPLPNGTTVTFGKITRLTFYRASEFYEYLKLLRGLRKV